MVSHDISVIHSVQDWCTRQHGFATIPRELSLAQKDLGVRPVIATVCSDGEARAHRSCKSARLVVNSFPTWDPSDLGVSLASLRWAASDLAGCHNVLHQHGIWSGTSLMTIAWRKAHAGPVVISPQGSLTRIALRFSRWKKRLAFQTYEGLNLRQADCLHVTSVKEAEGVRRLGLVNPVAVIPNGVTASEVDETGDATRFLEKHNLPAYPRRMLYLSRLHPKKGLELLFRALARAVRDPNAWQLIVAGPNDYPGYKAHLQRKATSLQLGDRVNFVGPVYGTDKNDAFAAADLFVLPTRSDNFALVVAEALVRGVPALTTEGAHPWTLLQQHRCGWWVPRRLSAIIAALKESACTPRQELRSMGKRGRELIMQRFLWRSAAKKSISLYRWLLGRGPQPDFVLHD